jgi:acetolactate synthase-1/2/3 large subunit
MKYSDHLANWLVKLGYTHCFFVGGGNIMHAIESFSKKLSCHAVIHEVAAGIATEYFNEVASDGCKALALITAGPGLTNIVTAFGGAYLESRELLVIGGQVKTADLARGLLRQRGIQEIDGISIVKSISKVAYLVDEPINFENFKALLSPSWSGRKGPVFIELPIDIQARNIDFPSPLSDKIAPNSEKLPLVGVSELLGLAEQMRNSKRPLLLIGGGVSRQTAKNLYTKIEEAGIPVATTWNGFDRIAAHSPVYVGRPNTWGQRSANLILQQSDLVIALGTRLGMQQTGFNWQSFVPKGRVIQVEIDKNELNKGHPRIDLALPYDVNDLLERLLKEDLGDHREWLNYAQSVRASVPKIEPVNKTKESYISPFVFVDKLSNWCDESDVVIPCSSGGAFTVMMQTFEQKMGQKIVTNKGLAAMGYGLAGAIGAAFANPKRRTIVVEGDGGFAQNMQEIGTAAINKLNLKIFIFDDAGYASIRMTQRSYFNGNYVGCDTSTGLGLPNWDKLFAAWDVPTLRIGHDFEKDARFKELFESLGVAAFLVKIDPEQTYFPKITSQLTDNGAMVSNPLHLMTPDLRPELLAQIGKFL